MKTSSRILAFDLHANDAVVASYLDGKQSQYSFPNDRNTACRVQATIQTMLHATNLSIAAFDVFAYHCGPGRFSGLRLAAGLVHAMAFVGGQRIVPCSGLLNMALQAYAVSQTTLPIAAIVPHQQSKGFYCAVYQYRGGQWVTILEPVHVDSLSVVEGYDCCVSNQRLPLLEHKNGYVFSPNISTLLDYAMIQADTSVSTKNIQLDYLTKNLFKPN
tara:strand:- start:200 stop:847 length:648 start_codon:yes stop_codon:yes gene_type:complete